MDEATGAILAELRRLYPQAKPELSFVNAYEILVAAILSAQCTDRQVNLVTETLFEKFPDAASLAAASLETVERYIKPCGFYHTKARHLIGTCQILVEQYGGQVPNDFNLLIKLPGVGRKVANVVMAHAFGADAIAVDTHVQRVSNRLGLAHARTPDRTEEQLRARIPKTDWSSAHLWIITHGRRVCHARNPECAACTLAPWCESHA